LASPGKPHFFLKKNPFGSDDLLANTLPLRDNEEYPRAYITLKPNHTTTADNIVNFMKDKVTPTKRITGGVVFVDSIPKNPSGKILRKLLREQANREIRDQNVARAKL
jgi:acyl-coenzyme A synthetase/AMP-(fatty) acid ligase